MRKRKPKTAEALMAKLRADPKWVREQQERDLHFYEIKRDAETAQKPILEDLGSAGMHVTSISDFTNSKSKTPIEAFPILVKHFQRKYPDNIKAAIARSLADPRALCAVQILLDAYYTAPPSNSESQLKYAISVALFALSDEIPISELIEIVKTKSHGDDRFMIIRALAKYKQYDDVMKVLTDLTTDPQIGGVARDALMGVKYR